MPSVLPGSVQVGSTAGSMTSVCPVAEISSVLVVWQTVQVKVFTPLSLQVGSVVISPLFQLCSFAEIISPSLIFSLQSVQ